ncbi:MAG: hypothetical protein ACK4F7_03505 [Inhella sp.]
MSGRRLPAFVLPVAKRRWDQLRFDGQTWSLRERAAPQAEQTLARVQIALEARDWRCLRLQWPAMGWRRFWPPETHLYLRRRDHAALWALMGAALAQDGDRPWLGH